MPFQWSFFRLFIIGLTTTPYIWHHSYAGGPTKTAAAIKRVFRGKLYLASQMNMAPQVMTSTPFIGMDSRWPQMKLNAGPRYYWTPTFKGPETIPKLMRNILDDIEKEELRKLLEYPQLDESELHNIPPHVQNVLKERFAWQDGPNCFNFALFWHGLKTQLTGTESDEFSALLKLNCVERDVAGGDNPKHGDIGVIFDPKSRYEFEHAFIYLENDRACTKNGRSQLEAPYVIQSLDEMLSYYQTSQSFVKYFKCRTVEAEL